MNRLARTTSLGWLSLLVFVVHAQAQQEPHVGYVYPAGGQRGTTLQITVGGQYLDGVNAVHVSGTGIEATVVDHDKPLDQRQINQVREKIQEAQKELRESEGGRFAAMRSPRFAKMLEEKGVTREDLQKLMEERRKRNDPKIQANPQIEEQVTLEVTLAEEAALGPRELRLVTGRGLSNPVRFCVGELPEQRENEPNDRVADSVKAPLPVFLNGQILPGDVDRFDFQARKGQRLVVAANARELIPYLADAVPGWFQATLTLLDSHGREVAYVDDFKFQPDPVLFYEIPEDGTYTLEIKDSIYRGREDFVYRIAIGELPYVTSVFPLGGRQGEKISVELMGWNLPKQTVSFENQSSIGRGGQTNVPVPHNLGTPVPFAVDALPECLEQEPNNQQQNATKIGFPVIVNGRIDRPGDWDLFRFEGIKGQKIVAEIMARRLNSPLDSVMELTDADGKQIALNDDHEDKGAGLTTHHADSRIAIELPAGGSYYLRLGDAQQAGGESYGYRLRVSPQQPDFELRVVPASVNVRAGGTAAITVFALRRDGFDGDIHLSLDDAPRGMALSGGRIPADVDQIRLTLTAPLFFREKIAAPTIVGTATIDGREVRRKAVAAEDMMQAFIYQHLVPAEEFLVSIQRNPRGGGSVRLLETKPIQIPVGGTALAQFAAPAAPMGGTFDFTLSNPPDGIAIERVERGPETAVLVLSADAEKAKPGVKGNLIVDVSIERTLRPQDGRPEVKRRFPVGILPAIAFEVVEPKTWLDAAISAADR